MQVHKLVYIFFLLLALSLNGSAQGPTDPLPPDPGCDPLDPLCPIDGGLSLLIAAAIGVGAKKAYDSKKINTATY